MRINCHQRMKYWSKLISSSQTKRYRLSSLSSKSSINHARLKKRLNYSGLRRSLAWLHLAIRQLSSISMRNSTRWTRMKRDATWMRKMIARPALRLIIFCKGSKKLVRIRILTTEACSTTKKLEISYKSLKAKHRRRLAYLPNRTLLTTSKEVNTKANLTPRLTAFWTLATSVTMIRVLIGICIVATKVFCQTNTWRNSRTSK